MKLENQSIYYEKASLENKIAYKKYTQTSKAQRLTIYIFLFILIFISIANMISTTFYTSVSSGKDVIFSFQNSSKHIVWMTLGMLSLCMASCIPYYNYNKKSFKRWTLLFSIITLIGVFVLSKVKPSIVPEINGAIGWVKIGPVTIQPSELLKIPYIILMANLLNTATVKKIKTGGILITAGILFLTFTSLIYLQKDLGTIVHYAAITCVLIFMTPISKKLITSVLTLIPIVYFAVVGFFYTNTTDGGYRLQRIKSYVDILYKSKETDMGIGYQVIQSLIAMGNGGILGRGYGNGIQKYNYLPEIHTDFISSSLAEEWGFFMMIVILLIFLLIQKIVLNTAVNSTNYFARYLAVGMGALIFTQMIINLYVATGLMPVTGVPLPFFSYGGSSTLTVFLAIGIILNVNKTTIKDKYS